MGKHKVPEALISTSKMIEDPTIAGCPLLSAHRQEKHLQQDLPENPPQTDHLGKGQGTELLISTDITVSIQNEAPENYPKSDSDRHFVHSVKSNQPFCQNQDNPQSDTAAPFDLDITLPAMSPSIQDMGKDDSKNNRKNDEIQSGERSVAQLQDQTRDPMEADNTESSLQELQESPQQYSLNELITASASEDDRDFSHSTGHNIIFEESHGPLLENPEIQMMNHDDMVRRLSSGKEQTGLRLGEVPDMTASCMLQPFEPSDLGHTREDSVIQNVPSPPRTPDPKVTEHQQKGQGPMPEVKNVPEVLFVNIDTPSGSECAPADEESPVLTSLFSATATSQSLTTTVQTVAPEDGYGERSMTMEEPLSNKEYDLYYNDPASFQKQAGLQSQPALPCKTLETSNAEVDVILGKTLIPSFAFLSATVCLVVGLHEPTIFLIMTVFLVSLCF